MSEFYRAPDEHLTQEGIDALKQAVRDYANAVVKLDPEVESCDQLDDFENDVFEKAMEMLYGPRYWDWHNAAVDAATGENSG